MNLESIKAGFESIGGILAVVAVISASATVIWGNITKGKINEKSTTLADENNTLGIMQTRIDALETQVKDLTSKLAMQETVIQEKDKHIKLQADQIQMMERIFQNRNPELETFIKNSTERIEILITASTKANECLEVLMKQAKIKAKK